MEGNLRFKIDWAGLIVGRKFTALALFYFVLEGILPSTSARGAYIWRGDLMEVFLRYRFGGLIFGGGLFSEFYGILSDDYDDMIYTLLLIHGGGYYWEFLVGVWFPVLRILTLLQTKKCHFPHPFSDQISKIHTHSRTWPNLACSRLSDSWGDSPVFSRFIFVFALSQRTQLSRSLEQVRSN